MGNEPGFSGGISSAVFPMFSVIRGSASGLFLFFLIVFSSLAASAQSARPIPHPITTSPFYERAVSEGTRTAEGAPGPAYWQNYASYEIDAVLSPATRTLRAEGRMWYFNRSPDQLDRLYLHLRQNLHRPEARRNRIVSITEGVKLASVRVGGRPLVDRPGIAQPGYSVSGTILRVELPEPLAPGDSVDLQIAWSFEVPSNAPRMGQDGEVYFLAFWYPQFAVYDDVLGWNVDQYLGYGEFYMGFADYNVRITVPEQWLVAATGTLQNADAIFSDPVRDRLREAAASDSVVHIVRKDERGTALRTSAAATHSWHFTASHVRDFAFGASAHYVWDGASARVDDGRRIPIHALYRPDHEPWTDAAEFTRWSTERLSEQLFRYPFAHMTAVEGLIGGGMEFPMITLIGGNRTPVTLFRTVFHEVAHIWYPMTVSQNEKAFAWMDEGLVAFLTDDALKQYWGPTEGGFYRQYYARVAGTGMELPSTRHTDEYPITGGARTSALYGKPAIALQALRGMVGQDQVAEALRVYTERWAYKHPYPWDLYRTFEDVLEMDLGWFWSALLDETWTLDHAVETVDVTPEHVRVSILDRSVLPLGTVVEVTYSDERTERRTIDVSHWLQGNTRAELTFPPGEIRRVVVDPDGMNPDIYRENDEWNAN